MHPAFSVIFLTTLIGMGQGLFMALVTGQLYAAIKLLPAQDGLGFYAFWRQLVLRAAGGWIGRFGVSPWASRARMASRHPLA